MCEKNFHCACLGLGGDTPDRNILDRASRIRAKWRRRVRSRVSFDYGLAIGNLVVGRRFARGRPSPASQQPNEMYLGLRKLALETSPTMIGLPSDLASSQPYGILMEIGLSNGVATLTSFASGDASLYFSRGGGILGGIADESIHNAAKRFVTLVASYVDRMEPIE